MKSSRLHEFVDHLVEVLGFSPYLRSALAGVDVIVNPVAGKISHARRFADELLHLRHFVTHHLERNRSGERARLDSTLHISERPGHVRDIVRGILDHVRPDRGRRIVISVGGDGTHEEVLSALYEADPGVLDSIDVFRLPMGTGNDAADAARLDAACEILVRANGRKHTGAIRICPTGLPATYSFNIASLGIDAFVSALSNRLKPIVPGDAYKLVADVATLFYSPSYRTGPVRLILEKSDGSREEKSGNYLLIAMGLSGRRTYGGDKPVLPGDENLCAFEKVGIFRKIALKKMLYAGTHALQPEAVMRSVRRVTIDFGGRLPLQADGEAMWLGPENFPLVMEVLDPRVPILTG